MNTIHQRSEKGQALVLLVIGFIVLLGFAALAIDGGMVYSDRRYAQNASDASSLAGGGIAALSLENSQVGYAGFNCDDARVVTAQTEARAEAISRASSNDFTIDTDVDDHHGVITACEDSFDNGSYVEKYIDVMAHISSTTQTSFAQFVYSGPMINNTDATTRVRPPTPMAFGFAIVSLADECPNQNEGGITFDGGGGIDDNVYVNGGGIFSNSCINGNGGVNVIVEPPDPIRYVDEYDPPASGSISPEPDQGPVELPDFNVPPPDCSSVPNRASPPQNGDVTLSQGRYSDISHNNGTLTMNPGLYCLTDDFNVNGDVIHGSDVTIYLINGDFSVGAGAEVLLDAPPVSCVPPDCPPAIPGMLIYLAEGNTGEVSLRGNSVSYYEGTVYAPNGTIDVGGGSSELPTVNTQLVGWTVKVHGNVTVAINFDDEQNYELPATLELYK